MDTQAWIALVLTWVLAVQTPAPAPHELLERGQFRDALEATAAVGSPRARAVRIQAWLPLLGIDEVPPALVGLIDLELEWREQTSGTDSPEYGEALLWRGIVHQSRTDIARARVLCAGHVAFTCEAEAIRHEGRLLAIGGQLRGGQEKTLAALAMHRARLGTGHPLTAQAEALAARDCLALSGEACGPQAERAVAALRVVNPRHPYLVTALDALARATTAAGELGSAVTLLEEALHIGEDAYGGQSTRLLNVLGALTVQYQLVGATTDALRAAHRAVEIADTRLGPDHYVTSIFLSSRGAAEVESGAFSSGLRSIARAVAIQERARPGSFELASALLLHGDALLKMGNHRAALGVLARAETIFMHTTGATSYQLLHVRMRQGDAAAAGGDHGRAVDLYSRALAGARTGVSSPEAADALLGRAAARLALGRLDEVRRDLEEAARLTADRAPARARYRYMRVQLDAAEERWADVLEDGKAALADYRAIGGDNNVDTIEPLVQMALAHEHLGQPAEALVAALEAERVRRHVHSLVAAGLPERSALLVHLQRATAQPVLARLAVGDAGVARQVWDSVIRGRGLVMDAVARRSRLSQSGDATLRHAAGTLAEARAALARAVVRGRGARTGEGYGQLLQRLSREVETAEGDVAALSLPAREARAESLSGLADVERQLPDRTALLGFLRADDRFVAFVTTGRGAEAVDLGPAAEIDARVRRWRREIEREATAGGRSAAANERRVRAAGLALREAVWDPLRSRVKDVGRVLVVPDGSLALVNFGALPIGARSYLVETGPLVHLLSSERDVVRSTGEPGGSGLLAIGNPAFESAPHNAPRERKTTAPGRRGGEQTCTNGLMTFDALPGTADEVRGVAATWRASGHGPLRALLGADATKAAVTSQAGGNRVLHFATHAYFVPKACEQDDVVEEEPLLRAGLALAGANRPGARDVGILTASEIASLDLRGTVWAVLSGCDTGVGDVIAGEGVLGLRRAFLTAGVRSVVASLWPVDDRDTAQWMRVLYTSHFGGERDTAEAVRQASVSRLKARRSAGESTHPFYWAGFVAVGDWR